MQCADFGNKGITVNAIAPGGIKTDMYVEAARKYIPNEAYMTDEQIDEVCCSPDDLVDLSTVLIICVSSLRPAGLLCIVLGCRKMFPA